MGQKVVNLSRIEILVIDEADRMFDMGFLPDIRRILAALPARRQTLLFSATMPDEIRGLADELLDRPVKVDLGVSRPVETIGHAVYPVDQTHKAELLLALLTAIGQWSGAGLYPHQAPRQRNLPISWSKPGCRPPHCRATCLRTAARRRWIISAPGG